MKILFTRNWTHENDYLSDMLLHGLRAIGCDVVDDPVLWYMYKDADTAAVEKLHGRGFTTYRTLDNITVDRTDTESKICNRYFDLVILSRADFESPYESLILEHYGPDKLIIVDGRDQPNLTHWRNSNHLLDCGTYFKRELETARPGVYPVSFAFPREKILNTGTPKQKLIAGAKPVTSGQYTFTVEADYYQDYAVSYFGETQKKGGWDCMRHYEIMAAGCVPWFKDIAQCPEQICTTLPKTELLAVCALIDQHGLDWFQDTSTGEIVYKELQDRVYQHFLANCTTEHLANYILNTHESISNGI
jgi:hypothetical protein